MNVHHNIKKYVMYMILLFPIQQALIGNEYKKRTYSHFNESDAM